MTMSFQPSAISHQQTEVGSQQLAVGSLRIQNPPSPESRVSSPVSLFAPPLEALAAMTEEQFREALRHSPIRRAKHRGWLRNLCVAMGNSGDARFIPRLTDLAAHPDSLVREHARWALTRLSA